MSFFAAEIRVVVGVISAFLCFLALGPALAALLGDSGIAPAILLGALLAGGLIGLFARSVRWAFGWSVLALALCVVALPLSTMLLAGRVFVEATADAAIVGFFLGAILLIVALILLLGGRRQVIVVDRATGHAVMATTYVEAGSRGRPTDRIEPPPLR